MRDIGGISMHMSCHTLSCLVCSSLCALLSGQFLQNALRQSRFESMYPRTIQNPIWAPADRFIYNGCQVDPLTVNKASLVRDIYL
jgi:hypothetical protein